MSKHKHFRIVDRMEVATSCQNSSKNDVKHLTNQLNLARNEINNLRQQLKSLTHAHRKDCEEIQSKLANWRCTECRSRQLGPSEAAALPKDTADLPLKYIGTIHTQFPEKGATPRQPGICSHLIAKLTLNNEVLTNPEHALEGLQEFSHMWILFHFHRNDSTHVRAKVAPPRLDGQRTGVFATRSPHRPCPVGLSLVKIDRIMENTIYFSGVDMVDQTPVLDIKPYIPQYDNPALGAHAPQTVDNDWRAEAATLLEAEPEPGDELDNVRLLDGDENGGRGLGPMGGASHTANSNLLESLYNRSTSRIGEREAPDGEEDEETPRQGVAAPNPSEVRIASWIDQPRNPTLRVLFKDSVLAQLNQFGTAEAEEKIRTINNVLKEDPRSVYLRNRMRSRCHSYRIASLYVSCKFDDDELTVTVFKISHMSEPLE